MAKSGDKSADAAYTPRPYLFVAYNALAILLFGFLLWWSYTIIAVAVLVVLAACDYMFFKRLAALGMVVKLPER